MTAPTATTEAGTRTTTPDTTPAGVELSGTVNDKGSADISGDGATPTIDIEVDDSYFSPTFVKATPGAAVTVRLDNEGDTTHTFTVDGGVDQQLEPGDEATVTARCPTADRSASRATSTPAWACREPSARADPPSSVPGSGIEARTRDRSRGGQLR